MLTKDTTLHGPLQAGYGGYIDGLVKGYVTVEGPVMIGKKAEIKGDVTAKAAKVFGTVCGNVTCDDIVIVYNTGVIKGDVKAKIILVKEGAHIEGVITKTSAVDEGLLTIETSEPTAEAVEAPVFIEQIPSTAKDKDATTWF